MNTEQQHSEFDPENSEVRNPQQDTPELYSKTQILTFAILFSTIFAAVLLMLNLKKLGKRNASLQVLIFAILYLLATGVIIQTFNIQPGLTVIANVIGAAILNEYFWNKHIGSDLAFKKKGWLRPLMISVLIVLSVFMLLLAAM